MALILFAASQHAPQALADSSSTGGGFSMVTTPSGQGTDLLYIIDDQTSTLMVYDLQNPQGQSHIRPVASWILPSMFSSVRN